MSNSTVRKSIFFAAVFSFPAFCLGVSLYFTEVEVLFTTAELKPGEPLRELNCEFRPIRTSFCPEGAVFSKAEVESRALKRNYASGSVVLREHLTERGDSFEINIIPASPRVTTIPFSTLKDNWAPGVCDLVDVWIYPDDESNKFKPRHLFSAEVRAIDVIKQKTISLLVDSMQLLTIQLAKKKGIVCVSPSIDRPDTTQGAP